MKESQNKKEVNDQEKYFGPNLFRPLKYGPAMKEAIKRAEYQPKMIPIHGKVR